MTRAILGLLVLHGVARADVAAVADRTAACARLRVGTEKCTKIATTKVKGLGTAELYTVRADAVRYALVIDDGKILTMTDPIEYKVSDRSMGGKYTNLVDATPRLRAFKSDISGELLALDITSTFESNINSAFNPWRELDVMTCAKRGDAVTCRVQHFGSRSQSCVGKLTADGVTTACTGNSSLEP